MVLVKRKEEMKMKTSNEIKKHLKEKGVEIKGLKIKVEKLYNFIWITLNGQEREIVEKIVTEFTGLKPYEIHFNQKEGRKMTKKDKIKIAMLLSGYRKLAKNVEGMDRTEPLFETYISIGRALDEYIFDMGQRLKISHHETIEMLNKIIDEEYL